MLLVSLVKGREICAHLEVRSDIPARPCDSDHHMLGTGDSEHSEAAVILLPLYTELCTSVANVHFTSKVVLPKTLAPGNDFGESRGENPSLSQLSAFASSCQRQSCAVHCALFSLFPALCDWRTGYYCRTFRAAHKQRPSLKLAIAGPTAHQKVLHRFHDCSLVLQLRLLCRLVGRI